MGKRNITGIQPTEKKEKEVGFKNIKKKVIGPAVNSKDNGKENQ